MAYSIKGTAIINDSRALLGVSTAGINTALFVGEEIAADGGSGIVTTKGMVVKDGDLNIVDGGNLVVAAGGSIFAEGIFLEIDGESVGVATIAPGGALEVETLDVNDYAQVGAGLTLNGSLRFGTGTEVSEIVTDVTGGTDAQLPTAAAVQSAITDAVGDAGTLDFVDDNGVLGQVNIGAGATLGIIGTDNEIETTVTVGLGTQLQIGLPDTLVIPGSMEVSSGSTFKAGLDIEPGQNLGIQSATGDLHDITHVGLSTALAETGSASFSVLPTEKAVKDYVDGVRTQVEASADLDIEANGLPAGTISLADQALNIEGTDNEVTVAGAGQTYTLGLPDEIVVTGVQAGVITATSQLRATDAVGVGLTVSGEAYVETAIQGGEFSTFAARNINGAQFNVGTADAEGALNNNLMVMDSNGGASRIRNKSAQDKFVFSYNDLINPLFTLDHSTSETFADLQGRLDVSNGAQITGVCTATDFNSTSDINKKENIVEIADAVEKVEALRGVTFDWKDGSGKSGGTIAQEVQAVLPEIVKEGEHLTVNYNGLTGLLIQAVKELSARVAELEGKA